MLNLGPHFQRSTPHGREWLALSSIVKVIDDTSLLADAPENALRIFRHYDKFESSTDGVGTASKCIHALGGYNHPNLVLQLWTGAHPARGVLKTAVQFCHDLGYKTLGSSWYTGDYTQQDWDDATEAGVDYHGPQCYGGKRGFTLDEALHYRKFRQPGQEVVIPECGFDDVEGGARGWLLSGWTKEQYAAWLAAFAAEIAKDPYVKGATAFVVGHYDPFSNYELEDVIPVLLPLLQGGAPVPDPVPSPAQTFDVGPGVRAAMAAHNDAPICDEEYKQDHHGETYASETYGQRGICHWIKKTDQTFYVPFP